MRKIVHSARGVITTPTLRYDVAVAGYVVSSAWQQLLILSGVQVINRSVTSFGDDDSSECTPLSRDLRGRFRSNLDRSGLGGHLR